MVPAGLGQKSQSSETSIPALTASRADVAFAGFQAGMRGTLLFVGWLIVWSTVLVRSPWFYLNLFATPFFGESVYRSGLHVETFSGLALLLLCYPLLGVAFAVISQPIASGLLRFCAALAAGAIIHVLLYGRLARTLAPLIYLYQPTRTIFIGHLFFGVSLAGWRKYLTTS